MPTNELLRTNGIGCTVQQGERLERYTELLLEWNTKMNLTGAKTADEVNSHILDCAAALSRHGSLFHGSVIDVGSGAGFPGIVLAVLCPDCTFVLADALQKRCFFLEKVRDELGLSHVSIMHARAEELGHRQGMRESFDLATARAVAPLNVLCEYLLPLVRIGGNALCYKGPKVKDELPAAQKASGMLGGGMITTSDSGILDTEHSLCVIPKLCATPGRYPRSDGIPARKPIT